jgi:BolA family transcriptional regulator, general stress-responsive regulator
MSRADRIKDLLNEAFRPSFMELTDDSAKHAGHAGARPGGETHYTLVIESEHFRGLNRVECHRAVHKVLADELNSGLHALSIKASAPK